MKNRKLVHILLFLVSASFSLLAAEFIVRTVKPQQTVRPHVHFNISMGVFRPNVNYIDSYSKADPPYSVRTNSLGMRMDEEVDRSPLRKKIIALGDSFTYGWGVELEDSFFGILKETIETKSPSIQLLNAGVSGAGTSHVFQHLKIYNRLINLSGVIYFMKSNDLENNIDQSTEYQITQTKQLDNGDLQLIDVKRYSPFKRFLLKKTPYTWLNIHSQLFVLLKSSIKSALGKPPSVSPMNIDTGKIKDAEFAYKVTHAHLRRLIEYCEDINKPLLIVWVPDKIEIKRSEGTQLSYKFFEDFKKTVLTDKIFDPTAAFQKKMHGIKLSSVIISDGHFNPLGNRIYYEVVQDKVFDFVKSKVWAEE